MLDVAQDNRPPIQAQVLTVADVARMVEDRIRSGEYPVSSRLPTVRELALELGVNRNTTVRAYQGLKRKGYLELVRGRGAFVRQIEPPSAAAESRWLARLDNLLLEAKQQSLTRSIVLHEVSSSVDRIFGQNAGDPRIAFVECNPPDVQMLGDQISLSVGRPIEGVLLSDFMSHPEEIAARFDLIATTFFHLGEVSWALGDESKGKVIGMLAKPTHDSLLSIARLHATVIGLVCTLSGTVDNLVHIVHTYHPSATILSALVEDEARLQTLFSKADVLVVTRVTYEPLMAHHPPLPVIQVTFTIDQQSLDFLRGRIWDRESTSVALD